MLVRPRVRGFICTTAHPVGCAANVDEQVRYVQGCSPLVKGPKSVLVIGCSGGFGLPSRIAAAFGASAPTLGISLEKPPTESKTASAGWYNNLAFERAAEAQGLWAHTLDGDAFSDEMKSRAIEIAREHMPPIDLVVYSLASPVRTDPETGKLWRSAIKPMHQSFHVKTLNVDRGEVYETDLQPATDEEVESTIKVMGGDDWKRWMSALAGAGVLAPHCRSVAYTYIGSDLTWPIYWHATLGKAKEDLDRAAQQIGVQLGDKAMVRVAVLKAMVTQASAAIPVVPLYASVLYRVMKEQGNHENPVQHIQRLFATQLYGDGEMRLDDVQRIRMDDQELSAAVQQEVRRRWLILNTENLAELADFAGFQEDFLRIFGFGVPGVDYDMEVNPQTIDPLT